MTKVLITGGCGFIGRHVAEEMLAHGHEVRLYDAMIDQVHGAAEVRLPEGAEVVRGDVRDSDRVREAMRATFVFCLGFGAVVAGGLWLARPWIASQFSGDPEVAAATGLTVAVSREVLEELIREGVAELWINDDGGYVYAFPELFRDFKDSAKSPLSH